MCEPKAAWERYCEYVKQVAEDFSEDDVNELDFPEQAYPMSWEEWLSIEGVQTD